MQVQLGIPQLCAAIRDRIARSPHKQIPFAEFMELALYHSEHGYYVANANQIGLSGDFATSPSLGVDFAELLAEQFADLWQRLGEPDPFHLVEFGPGQGVMADIILTYLHGRYAPCFSALKYTLIETSDALKIAQQARLAHWRSHPVQLNWVSMDDLPDHSVEGCLFSNEFVDALPVHRVVLTASGLQEQYVTQTENPHRPFEMSLGPLSTTDLESYFERVGIALTLPPYSEGYTTEVNLAALEWMTKVARKMRRGYLLTVDYGYAAERYYSPGRSQGTLQCYTRHTHHDDPLINIGLQDITAHVDFTALQQQGQQAGLETLGQTQQGMFLMALGLGDRLNDLAQLPGTDSATVRYAIQKREALHRLIDPMGLGNFLVLLQGKGLTTDAQRSPKGFVVPPLQS